MSRDEEFLNLSRKLSEVSFLLYQMWAREKKRNSIPKPKSKPKLEPKRFDKPAGTPRGVHWASHYAWVRSLRNNFY